MTKIMLVEDDNNLREIYEARLAAEGFTIVSAQDGEAALALAAKEHPDLVISDVMMPKISGFEMLDIMRNTANLRDVKVIMLTALGQAEDSARAGSLGADRYLVKSQVTLEDIVKAAHEVIDGPEIEEPGVTAPSDYQAAPADATPSAPTPDITTNGRTWTPAPTQDTEPVESTQPVYEASVPVEPVEVTDRVMPVEPDSMPADSPAAIEVMEPSDITPSPETQPVQNPQEAVSQVQPGEVQPETVAAAPSTGAPVDDTRSVTDDTTPQDINPVTASDSPSSDDAHIDGANQQDEADMRAQIDQFLVNDGDDATTEQAQSTNNPQITVVDPPSEAPLADNATTDDTPSDVESLPDEPDSEYEKDAASPDLGELSVQPEPEEATPQVAQDGQVAVEPSGPPAFDLPDVPQPAESIAPPATSAPSAPTALPVVPTPPVPADASGDQIVSDAVNHMMASAPSSIQPPDPYAIAPDLNTADPTKPASLEQAATPEQNTPEQHQAEYQSNSSATTHKRIIAPLGLIDSKPDINQLLALEEAKNGAIQAGNVPQVPQKFSVAPPPGVAPPPPTNRYEGQSFDPNSISL